MLSANNFIMGTKNFINTDNLILKFKNIYFKVTINF